MTTGTQIAHDKVDRYRSMGAFGKPAYQSYVQMRAMLLTQRKPALANYFAKPTYDPDLGELRWTAELPGAARRLGELGPDEFVRGVDSMGRIHAELQTFIGELRSKGGGQPGGAAAFASLLEQAMKVPAQGDFLYFVGEQPVIAFWGFEDLTRGSVDPAAQAPQLAAPAAPAAPVVEPVVAPPALAPVVAEKRKRPWWWWLLWLLLALLLVALLLFLVKSCMPTPPLAMGAGGVPDTKGHKADRMLEIPPGALEKGDLSFLDGVWQLGEERLNAYQGSPDNVVGSDRLVLKFGKDGTGTNHAVERLRRGARVPDCSGSLRARTDGKKLYFERLGCEVPGSSQNSVMGSQHECLVEANGKTMCYGINKDGVRWEAPLRRMQ